jgi:hypothetical protein
MYLQGLASMVALAAVSTAVAFFVGALFPGEAGAIAGVFCFAFGSVVVGYLYRRWNGPLFDASDRGGPGRLLRFILGAGTVLGLARMLGSESPLQDATPLVAIGTLLLSVPISGMGFIGPMFIGSLFYREPPSPDAAGYEWVVAVECPDSTTAQIAVARLQAESIPARVQNLASLPGLEPGSRVLVRASMAGRARDILSPSEVGESELEQVAVRTQGEE